MKLMGFLVHVLTGCSIMAVSAAKADALDEWHWRSPLPQGNDLRAITYGDGVFIAVGGALTILRSTNGVDWTSHGFNRPFRPYSGYSSLSGVTFTDGKFVAVGYEYGPTDVKGLVYLSSDGIHWTLMATPPDVYLNAVASGNGVFVAVGINGLIYTSPDGVAWTDRTMPNTPVLDSVSFVNGEFIIPVNGGGVKVLRSTNGVDWTTCDLSTLFGLGQFTFGDGRYVAVAGRNFLSIGDPCTNLFVDSHTAGTLLSTTFGNGIFVAVGERGVISTSGTGLEWADRGSLTGNDLYGLIYAAGMFVAVGEHGAILTSPTGGDSTSWTSRSTGTGDNFRGVTYHDGQFVMVGNGGMIGTSTDGATWCNQVSGTVGNLHEIVFAQDQYVAVGGAYSILTSPDATNWTSRYVSGSDDKLLGVACGTNKFVAVGGGTRGTVMISSNGITWSDPIVVASNRLHAVVYGNGRFLAVGAGGEVATSVDATNWTESSYGGVQILSGLAYANQMYVAAGNEVITVSTNGVTWQTLSFPDYGFEDITYGNGTFVAVGNGGLLLSSVDGLTWQRHLTGTDNNLRDITYGQSSFVAVGNNRTILQSGLTRRATLTSGPLGPGGFTITVAGEVGREYTIQTSDNLADWTELFRQTSLMPTFEYRDTNAATHSIRFYRAVTP